MITKQRSQQNPVLWTQWKRDFGGPVKTASFPLKINASESIEYDDGPKYVDFHSNWKRCSHMKNQVFSGIAATYDARMIYWGDPYSYAKIEQYCPVNSSVNFNPAIIADVNNHVTNQAVALLQDKFDLNCKDRVLAYSYALDLVPLLGPFLKASSVLNRIGKWAAKRGKAYRRRPFTMVVTDAMRADLINRFVVQTTIAETRLILSVFERCQRAWEQAHQRNLGWTTLTAEADTSKITATGTTSRKADAGNLSWPTVQWGYNRTLGVTSKVHAVLKLEYDIAKADPVKWIAQALGITTPLESVWDKIPFSFVCDYFFRVGELISEVSHLDSSQDGLYGKVCDVAHVWAVSKSFDRISTIDGTGQVLPYNTSMWAIDKVEFGASHYQSSLFFRGPIDLSNSSGFWDKGGFWNPRLSSTRKRTLLEMALLRAM